MENSTSTKSHRDEEISLKELTLKFQEWWKYLLSKWLIIFFAGVVGGILGFTRAYLKKPIYTAELSFALEDDRSGGGLGAAAGLASQFGFDLGGDGGGALSADKFLELINSS